MISTSTFQAIVPAHLKLKELNLALSVVANTPLSMLNDAANTPLLGLSTINDEEFFQQFPESVMRDSITGSTEPFELAIQDSEKVIIPATGEHELVLQELREMGRSRAGELFDYARNVMQPFVTSVIDGYAEPSSAELCEKWSIVDIHLNRAYLDPVVESLLGTYGDPTTLSWERPETKGQVRLPEELPVPVTGRASFDNLLGGVLSELSMTPKEALTKLFSEEFESPYIDNAWMRSPLRLAQWLLIQYYEKHPWENCGLSALAWETMCMEYRNSLTGWIAGYVKNLAELIQTNVLVMGIKHDTREIYVVRDIYEKFQSEHGGDAEAIYGSVYLRGGEHELPNFMLSTYVDRLDECRNAWARQVSFQEARLNENWVQDARGHMKRSFSSALDAFDDAYMPDDVMKSEINKRCAELIDERVDRFNMEDPTLLIITIARDTLFAHTGAGWVLEEIHKRMVLGMDGGEAATQTLIDYVFNWVLSMGNISK